MLHISMHELAMNPGDFQCAHDLLQLVENLKNDSSVEVVVFTSAHPDFFLLHYFGNPKGISAGHIDSVHFTLWARLLMELAVLPQTTVAIVEDKVKGAGNGFLIACDLTIHCSNPELALLPVFMSNQIK
ncbi:enoyl-CoA hydratase-related protein [Catalinimonas niigatensis]|uniref:enoyl-CoA hydratase-related protein n=1 Tax=Catalinimonas niigatensis TaxID=1397264 RepID=UPI0026670959|nr:enoyl-CoA hydratase-related protein [Catalinimonas niigatensis]WPP48717.1 enoyl-CoA hydratase-related protein [Catalinimonas niigatensis]